MQWAPDRFVIEDAGEPLWRDKAHVRASLRFEAGAPE
jgi:hypothetical protein